MDRHYSAGEAGAGTAARQLLPVLVTGPPQICCPGDLPNENTQEFLLARPAIKPIPGNSGEACIAAAMKMPAPENIASF